MTYLQRLQKLLTGQAPKPSRQEQADRRAERQLAAIEALVVSVSRANEKQAEVMLTFLDMFRPQSAPVQRMNGDQYMVDQQIERRMAAAGMPVGGSEIERLKWLYENSDKVGIRE